MKKLSVDIWSDIACPWCYVGKRRLEAALARFPQRDNVEVTWRAFELDTSAPREQSGDVSYARRLANKYGSSIAQAEESIARMTEVARGDGLDFRFDRIRPGNTFDAHRILHLAHEEGVQDALKERLLLAYMTEGECMGDPATLVRLSAEVGLDRDRVQATLTSGAFASEVRHDQAEARRLGVQGVPFFVFGGALAVSGAQPSALIERALGEAWRQHEAQPLVLEEGASCGPDGCA